MDFEIEYVYDKCICIKEFNEYGYQQYNKSGLQNINEALTTSKIKVIYHVGDICTYKDFGRGYYLITCNKNSNVVTKTKFFEFFKIIHFVIPQKKWYSFLNTIYNKAILFFTDKPLK